MNMAGMWKRREEWRPSAAQRDAVRNLADYRDGALARTNWDGSAEARVMHDGALHRYLIDRDGVVELIDVGPQGPRQAWAMRLCKVAFFAFLGGLVAVTVGEIADPMPWWHPEAAALAFLIGLAATFATVVTAPRLAAPRGEWWKHFPSRGH